MRLKLHFRLFGSFEISCNGRSLPKPATIKSQSLFAYLVLHRRTPQQREHLFNLFWGDRPESRARGSLSTAIWQIRRCMPDKGLILSDSETVQFDPEANVWLDVEQFDLLMSNENINSLLSGIELYCGDLLDGFYDGWIVDERYRLESQYSTALERVMAAQESSGRYDLALITAKRLLGRDPLREDGHRAAMRAYCHLGQRNSALAQYQNCRDILFKELGVPPTHETTDLYRAILEGRFETPPVIDTIPIDFSPPITFLPSGNSPLDATARNPMVGRETEISLLQQYWKEAESGRGKLIFITGEAGVGKTCLANEFSNDLFRHGIRVLSGRCFEYERLLPYQPIAEVLRTVLPTLSLKERADFPDWVMSAMFQLIPELIADDRNNALLNNSSEDQTRLFGGVTQFLSSLSTNEPILIVLEDLHWASESTLQFLHYLVCHLTANRVLLIGTHRAELIDARHPLLEIQEQLIRDGIARKINLHDLSAENIETMIVKMSGDCDAAAPLSHRLYQETEGNPFFLMETIKGLFESGTIHVEKGKWIVDLNEIDKKNLPLPESLTEAIRGRIRRLGDNDHDVLQLAAVLGREFDFDLLKAVWGRDDDATLEVLDGLLRQRFIEEGSGSTCRDYVFTHHKIREVVYREISRQKRQRLHAKIAMSLENLRTSQIDLFAGEIAFHYEQCQSLDQIWRGKAIKYLVQSGDRARFLSAFQDALNYYQRALVILRKSKLLEQAAQVLMKMGLAYHMALEFEKSRRAYDEGLALWRSATPNRDTEYPPAPHPLRVSWREPETLDPVMAEFEWSTRVIDQLFCGLVDLTPDLDVIPDVAHSWDVTESGHKYIFHLRDDVQWSDGVPVTAGDFEYAWKRALLPAHNLSIALLEDIKGAKAFHQGETSRLDDVAIHALDELTLKVEVDKPNGSFLYLLPQLFPIPRHVATSHGNAWAESQNIVTNGPFILKSWIPGDSIILSRNPHYHGDFTGNIQQVELCLIPNMSEQLGKYESGELDFFDFWTLSPAERDRARLRNAGEYVSLPEVSSLFLGFDVSHPPFDDLRVRQAFALATDKEKLANVVMHGCVAPATGGLLPAGMTGHSAGIGLPYDPLRAKRLLIEAGYSNTIGSLFPPVNALVPKGALNSYVDSLRTQWVEAFGVNISWQVVEHAFFTEKLNGDLPQIYLTGWMPEGPDPGILLRASRIQQHTRWQNERYANLVEKGGQMMDQAERIRLYQEADQILMEEAPIVPLTYGRNLLLVKPWVKRYATSPITRWLWKDIVIEPH